MTLSQTSLHQQLEKLVDDETSSLDSLLSLLEEEKNCLHNDVEKLEKITALKQIQISQLEQLSMSHNQLLTANGFTADSTGMKSCLQDASNSPKLLKKWGALRDKIKFCQEINVRNGALVEISRQRSNQLLSILLGQQPGSGTYDNEGKSNTKPPNTGSVSFKA